MCCCKYSITQFPTTDPLRFSFLPSPSSPHFVSFRLRPIRSALNSSVSNPAMSFYDLLGIPETGSLLEIKQAYKQLARKYHPDVSPPGRAEEYTERFIRVQEAYETLSDPKSRELYDRDMAMGLHLAFSARRRCKVDEDLWGECKRMKKNMEFDSTRTILNFGFGKKYPLIALAQAANGRKK